MRQGYFYGEKTIIVLAPCASIANENQDCYLLCELNIFSIMLKEMFDKQESSIFWKHMSMFFRATKLY